jgi:hypothetical protein
MKQQVLDLPAQIEEDAVPVNAHTESDRMDLTKHLKELQRLSATLKKLNAPKKPLSDHVLADTLGEAIAAAKAFNPDELEATLEQEAEDVRKKLEDAIEHRRESLLGAAREANVSQKRFGEFDRVSFFKVSYRGKKVLFEIGSERVAECEATDGTQVLAAIQQQQAALEAQPFSRDEFFRSVRDAIRLARERGKDRDGWVPVRLVYVYVVLLRNLQFEDFMNKPSSRSFRDYSSAQFVFDLARFGKTDWSCGDETLRGETPNMATVSAGKSLTLPNLDELDKLGHQFARVRIEKGAAGGT